MTPQDDTTRYLPTPDNDAVPIPTPLASAPHVRPDQVNSAPHRDLTAWQASDTDRAQSSRSDALPTLPQGPSRLLRRWHLVPDEAVPVSTQSQTTPPHLSIPATLRQHSPSATQPAPHAAQTDTLSLAAQMMAQESPITEQGPPASNIDSPWINGAPGLVISPSNSS